MWPACWRARRQSFNEAKAAVAAATFGDAMAHFARLPQPATAAMRLQKATSLVLESHDAFSRSQCHLHREVEIAVARGRVWIEVVNPFVERLFGSVAET